MYNHDVMGVKFTDEQRLAIDTLDKSVLVSAAAGSGKTAVLVERILNIILEGKANVDEMLVVTFTNAAASEMRLRLAREIRRRMQERPEDAPRLKDQLGRLYRAYISTIDSFALRVIREFFYESDIDPDAGICDDVQGELMRREAVNEVFEEGFARDDFLGSDVPGFRELLRLYSSDRSEDKFKENMLRDYSQLRTMPDYFVWASRMTEDLLVTPETFGGSRLQQVILRDAMDTFRSAAEAAGKARDILYDAGLGELYEDKLAPEAGHVLAVYESLREGGLDIGLIDSAAELPRVTMRVKKAQEEAYAPVREELAAYREAYKKELRDWSSRYGNPDFRARLAEMNSTYSSTVAYIRLLGKFESAYQDKKRERRLLDFADMEHGAVKILSSDSTADIMRRRFRYIFVDEYQDTNNIQELLISRVSRPDNVFRVGDVKQSIYKFRQAEPEIFERAYRRYSDPAEKDGITIDLSKNFRSNDATIRYINKVFGHVMEGYDERARLYTGTPCPAEYDFVPEVHVLTTEESDMDGSVPGDGAGQAGTEMASVQAGAAQDDAAEVYEDPVLGEISDLSKEEAEAAYIAEIAEGLLGTEFCDTKSGEIRRAAARDIVILFRAVRARGDIMARMLRLKGIESHVEESDDFFNAVEIETALSLLTCIDNMKRDIPLIAALHSEAFGWSPGELAEIRIAHNKYLQETAAMADAVPASGSRRPRPAYWEALEWYRTEGPEGRLRDRARAAADKIIEWRRLSRMMKLEDFVWKVLTDSGIYMMAGAMNGGARRQANLRSLADRAAKYSGEGISSLSSFITFLDVMRKKKISNGQASMSGSGDDVIRILTIHKSKGLEYPFVIVGGLGHRFRYDNNERSFCMDSECGVGLPYVDPGRKYWRSTIIQRAINAKSRRDSYREELRVLYVAMTRARNKLILTGTCKSEEAMMEYTSRPGDFLSVMRDVLRTDANEYYIKPLDRSGQMHSRRSTAVPDAPEALSPAEQRLYDEIDRRFSYEYPDADLLTAKAKYSVSEIRLGELVQDSGRVSSAAGRDAHAAISAPDEERRAAYAAASEPDAAGRDAHAAVSAPDEERRAAYAAASEPDAAGRDAHAAISAPDEERRAADNGAGSGDPAWIAYGPGAEDEPGGIALQDDEVVSLHQGTERRKKASAADRGIAYHRIMEFVDFGRVIREDGTVDTGYIRERAEFLVKNEAIDPDVYRELDLDRIAEFFRTDIGVRAVLAQASGNLRKEKAFTLKTRRQGRDILVQGVIDCCFEEDGHVVLLDYKSGRIRPGAGHAGGIDRIRREYRTQIELYSEAVSKGLGREVSEAYLYLFQTGELIDMMPQCL